MTASVSTHVLDTAAGKPAAGVRVELARRKQVVASGETDADGRIAALASDLEPGRYELDVLAAVSLLQTRRARGRARGGSPSHPPPRLAIRVRELPRKLSVEELSELFEGRTRLVERLAEVEDPLGRADDVLAVLSDEDKVEALAAHPAIGQRRGLSSRSAAEQGGDDDPCVLVELTALNNAYEKKYGFRFVVFVNRRPRAEILEVLRQRIGRTREEELDTGCQELVAIARDRWIRT